MSKSFGLSVIIPTCRTEEHLLDSLRSVCISVQNCTEINKEVVLCVDRPIQQNDPLLRLQNEFPFIVLFENTTSQGAAFARNLAIEKSKYHYLLFTDDDCWVPIDWVDYMFTQVKQYGVVTGGVCSHSDSFSVYAKLEQQIDYYRLYACDGEGHTKFISFPNTAIRRDLLPLVPFDTRFRLNADDMDLGCRLRLGGKKIKAEKNLFVKTYYPKKLKETLIRKIRHAKGIAYVCRRLGKDSMNKLEFGARAEIILRWIKISLGSPFRLHERLLFLLMNMTYCFGFIFYYQIYKNIEKENARNIVINTQETNEADAIFSSNHALE